MTLHTLLALYYLCDQTAAQRLLSRQEAAQCIAHYERVKLEFIEAAPARPGTPERATQNRAGYAGFKAWEADNADAVRRLKADARRRITP
ncbi:hypothetical protein [Sagittula sp. S175]|uniref:hypothetical protein n=1 Tax=Sagittula sp. S175 TaxID=3415129 RepID=UPI003C79B000